MNSPGRRWFLGLTIAVVAAVAGYFAGKRGGPEGVDEPTAPLIGIASLESEDCVSAVIAAGGVPVVLPDTEGSEEKIAEYLEKLDGLLMPGGLVVSFLRVRCMRSWRPFCCGCPGLMRSMAMPRRSHQTESFERL